MKKEWVRFLSVKAFVPLISFFIDAINHRQYFILYFNRKQSEMFFNTVSICTQRPLHEKGVSFFSRHYEAAPTINGNLSSC